MVRIRRFWERALPVDHSALVEPWRLPAPFGDAVRGRRLLPDDVRSVPFIDAERRVEALLPRAGIAVFWILVTTVRTLVQGDWLLAAVGVVLVGGVVAIAQRDDRWLRRRRGRDEPVFGLTVWPATAHDDAEPAASPPRPAALLVILRQNRAIFVPRTALHGFRFGPTADGHASLFVSTTVAGGFPSEMWLGDLAIGAAELDAHLRAWFDATRPVPAPATL